jgi:O-Antigen ligase
MPEHIRALITILILSAIGFNLAGKMVLGHVNLVDFKRWRNLWLMLTVTAFLAHNFWIYVMISGLFILLLTKLDRNKLALFYIMFVAIPPIKAAISGMGMVNYLLFIDQLKFASITILIPAALIIANNNNFKFLRCKTDIFILLYMLVIIGLNFRDATFTDALRPIVYSFLEIFLPYYVASRSIKDLKQMKVAMFAFVTTAVVMSFIAVFESLKHWLLYNSLPYVMGEFFDYGKYLGRGDSLRSIGTLAHPIALGFFMVVAFGFYMYLNPYVQNKKFRNLGYFVLTLGLLAPVSRGPWTGAAVMIVVFILQGPKLVKNLTVLFVVAFLSFLSLFVIPNGEKYLNLIPFYGKTEVGNLEYRQKLFNNSMIVIARSPLLGSPNYKETPEMQEMIQGEGIIDIVNFYIAILLESGVTGLNK